jgi:hypothetical protein
MMAGANKIPSPRMTDRAIQIEIKPLRVAALRSPELINPSQVHPAMLRMIPIAGNVSPNTPLPSVTAGCVCMYYARLAAS